jgi:hypothetical protein
MGGFLIMLFFIIVCVILFIIKTSNNDADDLLRNSNTAASSTSDNETQTADGTPNDGSTPTTAQPTPQGAPLTREELDRLLFKYHDKLFGTIVKAILMAMFIWSAIGGIIAGFIVAASVH